MSDVFLSYPRTHQAFAKRLHAALELKNKDDWVDWKSIPPAAHWMPEIEEAIDAADVFVFVITADSLRSKVCAQELDRAVKRNKRLIPLLCEAVVIDKIPAPLLACQLLQFLPADDFDASFSQLVTAIDLDLAHVKDHTRLSLRSDRWAARGRDPSLLLRDMELDEAQRWLAAGKQKNPTPTALHDEFIKSSSAALKQSHLIDAERLARARRNGYALQLSRVDALPESAGDEAQRLLDDPSRTPLDLRDFCWGFLHRRFAGNHRQLNGGSGEPRVVCLSPDGRLAAAGFSDGSVALWSGLQGMPMAMSPHSDAIRRLQFSPDGARLASASDDGIVQIVDASNGQPVGRMVLGIADHVALAFTLQGRLHVVAARGGAVFVKSLGPARRLAPFASQPHRIVHLEVAAQGRHLIVARDNGAIEVHTVGGGSPPDRLALDVAPAVLAISSNGRRVAWAGPERGVVEVRHGKGLLRRETIAVPEAVYVRDLRFSPDGRSLAVAGNGRRGEPMAWLMLFGGPGYRQARPLHGHLLAPWQISFSANGTRVASCGMDGLIVVNDLEGSHAALSLAERIPAPRALAWSSRGRWMASAGAAGGVDVQAPTTGERKRWNDPSWLPNALAFSPDETTLAATAIGAFGTGGCVKLWDIATGNVRLLHEAPAYSLAWSVDGRQLAIGARGEVVVCDTQTGEKRCLVSTRGPVRAVAFSPDGTCLASGLWTNEICLTHPRSGESRGALKGHSAAVIGLAFLDGGRQLVSLSEKDPVLDGPTAYMQRQSPEMIFWDLESAHERVRIEIEEEVGVATSLASSPDGSLIATAHHNGTLCLWDPVIAVPRLVIQAHRAPVVALIFSPDGRTIASSTARVDDCLAWWRTDDWRSSALLKGHKGEVHAVAFTPDSQQLISASGYDGGEVMQPGEILLWDPRTAQCRRLFSEHDNAVSRLAISPDGRSVAALTQRAVVAIDISSGATRWRGEVRGSDRSTLAYSTDGSTLLACGECFDAGTGGTAPGAATEHGRTPRDFPPPDATVHACSADGQWFAAGNKDGYVQVWNGVDGVSATGKHRNNGPLNALALSADGCWLATAGGASSSGRCHPGAAVLWRVADMTVVRTLWGHTDAVLAVAFSPDGQYLATGGRSQRGATRPGDVRLWHLPALLAELTSVVTAASNDAATSTARPAGS